MEAPLSLSRLWFDLRISPVRLALALGLASLFVVPALSGASTDDPKKPPGRRIFIRQPAPATPTPTRPSRVLRRIPRPKSAARTKVEPLVNQAAALLHLENTRLQQIVAPIASKRPFKALFTELNVIQSEPSVGNTAGFTAIAQLLTPLELLSSSPGVAAHLIRLSSHAAALTKPKALPNHKKGGFERLQQAVHALKAPEKRAFKSAGGNLDDVLIPAGLVDRLADTIEQTLNVIQDAGHGVARMRTELSSEAPTKPIEDWTVVGQVAATAYQQVNEQLGTFELLRSQLKPTPGPQHVHVPFEGGLADYRARMLEPVVDAMHTQYRRAYEAFPKATAEQLRALETTPSPQQLTDVLGPELASRVLRHLGRHTATPLSAVLPDAPGTPPPAPEGRKHARPTDLKSLPRGTKVFLRKLGALTLQELATANIAVKDLLQAAGMTNPVIADAHEFSSTHHDKVAPNVTRSRSYFQNDAGRLQDVEAEYNDVLRRTGSAVRVFFRPMAQMARGVWRYSITPLVYDLDAPLADQRARAAPRGHDGSFFFKGFFGHWPRGVDVDHNEPYQAEFHSLMPRVVAEVLAQAVVLEQQRQSEGRETKALCPKNNLDKYYGVFRSDFKRRASIPTAHLGVASQAPRYAQQMKALADQANEQLARLTRKLEGFSGDDSYGVFQRAHVETLKRWSISFSPSAHQLSIEEISVESVRGGRGQRPRQPL